MADLARQRRLMPALFCGLFLLGLLLRLHAIGAKPFWLDEITTVRRTALPFVALVHDAFSSHHLPLYFILLSWLQPLGMTETVARLPSAIFGAAAAAVVGLIGARLGGLRVGVFAGLLMALSPSQVQYGQEARSYALTILAIVVALKGLVELALDPAAASRPLLRSGMRAAWTQYFLGTFLALNVLSDALPWLVAASFAAVAIARSPDAERRGFARNWIFGNGVLLALSLFSYGAVLVWGRGGVVGGLEWIPPLTLSRVWSTVAAIYLQQRSNLISSALFPPAVPGLALAMAVLTGLGIFSLRRRPGLLATLVAGCAVLPVLLLSVSLFLRHPIWMPRYVLWSAPALFLLAAYSLELVPRRLRSPALAAAGLILLLNLAPYYQDETKPRWDLAAAAIAADAKPADLVLVKDAWTAETLRFFLDRTPHALRPAIGTDPKKAAAALGAGRRVWAITGPVGQSGEATQADFARRLAPLGPPAAQIAAGHAVILYRFDPPAKRSAARGRFGGYFRLLKVTPPSCLSAKSCVAQESATAAARPEPGLWWGNTTQPPFSM